MKTKIKLYNHYHYGDIFYSRMMIELLKKDHDIEFYHNLKKPLLSDIEGVTEINGIPGDFPIGTSRTSEGIINCWMGQYNGSFLNKVNLGCSWENYMYMYSSIVKELGYDIPSDFDVLPKLYKENLEDYQIIENKVLTLKKNYERVVLISNGMIHSGQAHILSLDKIIEKLSSENSDKLFFTTQKVNITNTNVINVYDITNKSPDLIQISALSTFCDVIIGRASGPYCYTQNSENLLDESKTFLGFSLRLEESKFYDNMKSKFDGSTTSNVDEIYEIIKKNI